MKKIIILTVILILAVKSLYSQNSIDPPRLPDTVQFNPTTIHIVNFNNPTIFRKNTSDFQICWNYGEDGRQLDKLMSIKGYLHNFYLVEI